VLQEVRCFEWSIPLVRHRPRVAVLVALTLAAFGFAPQAGPSVAGSSPPGTLILEQRVGPGGTWDQSFDFSGDVTASLGNQVAGNSRVLWALVVLFIPLAFVVYFLVGRRAAA